MNTHINFEVMGKMVQKQIGYQYDIKTIIICNKSEFQEIHESVLDLGLTTKILISKCCEINLCKKRKNKGITL